MQLHKSSISAYCLVQNSHPSCTAFLFACINLIYFSLSVHYMMIFQTVCKTVDSLSQRNVKTEYNMAIYCKTHL